MRSIKVLKGARSCQKALTSKISRKAVKKVNKKSAVSDIKSMFL